MPKPFRALLSFILVSFLLISCTTLKPSPVFSVDHTAQIEKTIYVDSHFTTEERAQILAAGNQWTFATRGRVVFHFLIDENIDPNVTAQFSENRLLRISIFHPFIAHEDALAGAKVLGATSTQPGNPNFLIVIVWERLDDSMAKFEGVIIHELGHSIGLQHENSCPSIMNSSVYWKYDRLSRYDLQQFCKLNFCNVDELNYFNYIEIQNCSY